jgi:sigma-E factor negative regulatory protein RseA
MDKISELMDGELEDQQARQQLHRLKQDGELAQCWHDFHLIGDALRGEHPLSQGFTARLASRLAEEPTVLAPHRSKARHPTTYALSAAASLSAVALVGWVAFSNNPAVEIAKAPPAASAVPSSVPASTPSTQLASVPSDGKMNEYLMAHQEFSPSTTIQGLAPYIRSVSITQPAQSR